jgi:hypothetical protein
VLRPSRGASCRSAPQGVAACGMRPPAAVIRERRAARGGGRGGVRRGEQAVLVSGRRGKRPWRHAARRTGLW